MRGLNMGVNTYNALIQSATLSHPSIAVFASVFLHISRGSAAYAAPRPGYSMMPPIDGAQKVGSLTLAGAPPQLPICGGPGVFRDAQIVN